MHLACGDFQKFSLTVSLLFQQLVDAAALHLPPPFSREAVNEASPACRIFVVDTFWRVIVHYADSAVTLAAGEAAGEAPLPFPPSRDSAIGQYLELRQAVRPAAGHEVVYSRPGTPEVRRVEYTRVAFCGSTHALCGLFRSDALAFLPSPLHMVFWLCSGPCDSPLRCVWYTWGRYT